MVCTGLTHSLATIPGREEARGQLETRALRGERVQAGPTSAGVNSWQVKRDRPAVGAEALGTSPCSLVLGCFLFYVSPKEPPCVTQRVVLTFRKGMS